MITDPELTQARGWQLALMVDECRITRPGTSADVWDAATETMIPGPAETVYAGPCRVAADTTRPAQRDAAGEPVVTQAWWVTLPWDVEGVRDGDRVEVTMAADLDLTGRVFTVAGVAASTFVTARRLNCTEVR